MGLPENPTGQLENQEASRRKRSARRPRARRCLLKGCEQRFHPRQAPQRYCSEGCRKAARRWSRWRAQQRYRAIAAGKQKRNGQSRRYRERVRGRNRPEKEAVGEAARVITEKFFRWLLRPAWLLPGIPARAAKSLATLLFPGLPARDGARPTAGAALETAPDLIPPY